MRPDEAHRLQGRAHGRQRIGQGQHGDREGGKAVRRRPVGLEHHRKLEHLAVLGDDERSRLAAAGRQAARRPERITADGHRREQRRQVEGRRARRDGIVVVAHTAHVELCVSL
jgi:hypothetical protein